MTTTRRFFLAPRSHFFLFGPRGTGKATWLRECLGDALWIDLLDPPVERELASRPERLRQWIEGRAMPLTVVLDEVQRAPAVLSVVHQLIEERRGQLRFALTGSSARKLKRAGVDLLAHRAELWCFHPYLAAVLTRTERRLIPIT